MHSVYMQEEHQCIVHFAFSFIYFIVIVETRDLMCTLLGKCSAGEYECAFGGECVTAVQLCDGVRHCSDGSDEDWRSECAVSSPDGIGRVSLVAFHSFYGI